MSTRVAGLARGDVTRPIVQVSLDVGSVEDALRLAGIGVEAGVDWLEVGTPLALAEGTRAVSALRREFPAYPLVADLKIMDGGYGSTVLYGGAGADAVTVMGRAHDATVEAACRAGDSEGLLVMGDDMGAPDPVTEAVRLESLGIGMIVHHIGHDHRSKHPEQGLSPLRDLSRIIAATTVPVQAVGGMSMEQAAGCPAMGSGVVVFGAPLVRYDRDSLTSGRAELTRELAAATARVHGEEVTLT